MKTIRLITVLFFFLPEILVSQNLPDLIVTTASLTYSSVQAGSSQTVTFTVKNQGTGNAGATTTQVRINTSSSSSSPSDAIKQDVSTSSIAAGGQLPLSATLTIPSSSTAGTYYAHIILDNYSARPRQTISVSNWRAGERPIERPK